MVGMSDVALMRTFVDWRCLEGLAWNALPAPRSRKLLSLPVGVVCIGMCNMVMRATFQLTPANPGVSNYMTGTLMGQVSVLQFTDWLFN